jgi:hypothetical protein
VFAVTHTPRPHRPHTVWDPTIKDKELAILGRHMGDLQATLAIAGANNRPPKLDPKPQLTQGRGIFHPPAAASLSPCWNQTIASSPTREAEGEK